MLHLLPPIPPSIRVFSNESTLCIRWPKYWSCSISPCNEYSGLISLRIDWFNLFAIQGNLKNLPSPVDHILSDLSTMTCPSWVAPQTWLSFIELDKAVFHWFRQDKLDNVCDTRLPNIKKTVYLYAFYIHHIHNSNYLLKWKIIHFVLMVLFMLSVNNFISSQGFKFTKLSYFNLWSSRPMTQSLLQ